MLKKSEKPLHEGTKHCKLSATVHLYNLKCIGGISNNSFSSLLEFIIQLLPTCNNTLPANTYEEKKFLREYIYIYNPVCYNVLFFRQAVKGGTPPTRVKSYIKTHMRKDGSYPNDIVKERCVYYSPFIYCFTYMCDNLFTMRIYLTHQHLIQHAGKDGRANSNRPCRIVKCNTRNNTLET